MTSCSKDNTTETPLDQLPLITTTGANTAGCIINGKIIIPKNGLGGIGGGISYGLDVHRSPNFGLPNFNEYFSIDIANLKDGGNSYWIYVHLNDLTTGAGNYTVGQSNNLYFIDGPNNPQIIVRETYNNVSGKTFISGSNSGIIIVSRFDFINKVMAGTFNCTLYNKDNPSETIQVTDGRFDIKI